MSIVDLFSRGLNVLGLESLESSFGDLDVSDEGVELVDAVLVLVPQPRQADPHPEGDAPHALGPDGLVQTGVDPHVLGPHLLLSKLLDLLKQASLVTDSTISVVFLVYISTV